MKRISKKAILPTVVILLCTVLFATAGAMIYGTEVIAYTYDIGSDQSCEFTW